MTAVLLAAVLFLVAGTGVVPRRPAAARTIAVTCGYTAMVGLVDALTGGNCAFLRHPPGDATLLSVLGPWPGTAVDAVAPPRGGG